MSSKYYLFVLLIVALAACPASAYIINETDNTPLFFDDFDSQPAANVSHIAYPDTATAGQPVSANVLYGGYYDYNYGGSGWGAGGMTPNRYIQVTDHNDVGMGGDDPGAYAGSNYLRHYRGSDTAGYMAQIVQTPQDAGDLIHWEMMYYISEVANGSALTYFRNFNTSKIAFYFEAGKDASDNLIIRNSATTGVGISGITYEIDKWQKWEVDYVVGASTYSLTVDGTTVSGISVSDSTAGFNAVSYGMFASNYNNGPWHMDEVPEPSTLALLGCGLIGLLAYAWRKRK
ncbi:MAG: PEP-CTERM sorting domain-containing protein [Pirellulales bacterium]|nr:PEP-CTERM sorting domain-containing protein [Pirellulales bacterium]